MGMVPGAPRGATWLPDNSIIVATTDSQSGLVRLPPDGGAPTVLTKPGSGELDHLYPSVLPGGVGVLFTVLPDGPRENMQVAVLDLSNGKTKTLVRGGAAAEYLNPGLLLYAISGTLRAIRFDLSRLTVVGDPVTVMEQVVTTSTSAGAFATSTNGTLAYVRGTGRETAKRTLVWVDRNGVEEALTTPPHAYIHPRISPDETRVALSSRDQDRDIWIWDLTRQILDKLTSGTSSELNPVWTPDSRHVMFASSRGGLGVNVFRQQADTTGAAEPLTTGRNAFYPISINADGTRVVLVTTPTSGIQGLAVLHVGVKTSVETLFDGTSRKINGEISPSGRWLAYQSNETGRDEIYVRPFPDVSSGPGLTISSNGGTKPLWAKSADEMFFVDTAGYLMSVPIQTTTGFVAERPRRVFETRYFSDELGRTYDVSRDGSRFLVLKNTDERASPSEPTMFVVLNWITELTKVFSARPQ
jgi:serine/threonine-protein kinase